MESLQSLELVLKDISTSVASNYQQELAIAHKVESFLPVSPDFAHNELKQVVGVYAFFSFLDFFFVSGFTTEGISYHFRRSSVTASIRL